MPVSGGINWNKPYLGPAQKWGYRGGKVLDILAFPCAGTPEIWIKAAWQALPTLILTPIKPSWLDYLIIRMGGGHGKRKRKWMDVWDFEFLEKVPKYGVSWAIIRLGSLGARALWYIAVADAITGFILNWVSAAYQYSGCNAPGEPYAQCFITGGGVITPGSDFLIPTWASAGSFIYGAGGAGITVPGGGIFGRGPTLMFDVGWSPDPLHPTNFSVPSSSIVCVGGTGEVDGIENSDVATSNFAHQNRMTLNAGNQIVVVTYRVRLTQGGGYAQYSDMLFSAHGTVNRDAVRPDP